MNPIFVLPATCELCGDWLPGHSTSCPRNGKHPSQWKSHTKDTEDLIKDLLAELKDDNETEDQDYLLELSS